MYYYTLTVAFWKGLENSNTWYTRWCFVKHGLGQNRPIYNVKHVFDRITSPMWTLKKMRLISLSDVSGTMSTRRHELLHQISLRSIQRLLRQYLNLMLAPEWNQTQWLAKGLGIYHQKTWMYEQHFALIYLVDVETFYARKEKNEPADGVGWESAGGPHSDSLPWMCNWIYTPTFDGVHSNAFSLAAKMVKSFA